MPDYAPLLERTISIAAPPARVWDLVSDVTRMAEWSPTVMSTRLRHGATETGLGVEFTNLNRQGELEWKTRGEVVRFDPDKSLAFRIQDNWVVWSFTLEPAGSGTQVIQRRETPDGISAYSLEQTKKYLGGQDLFTEQLLHGMEATLERLKVAAEGSTPPKN